MDLEVPVDDASSVIDVRSADRQPAARYRAAHGRGEGAVGLPRARDPDADPVDVVESARVVARAGLSAILDLDAEADAQASVAVRPVVVADAREADRVRGRPGGLRPGLPVAGVA